MLKRKYLASFDDLLGNPFIYYYQKTLLKLTGILIIAAFIVVRGSTAPLINDSPLLRYAFYSSPNGDKTLYNIGISVIAAYIFYIFQIYIPERNMFRQHSYFSDEHRHLIYLLNQYTLAWQQFLGKEKGECHFHEFSYKLNHNEGGSVTQRTYEETIEELTETIDRIIQNPNFANSDISYREFISRSKRVIEGHLKYMDDEFPRWNTEALYAKDYMQIKQMVLDDMKRIQNRLSCIEGYKLKLIEIEAYSGESKLQKLADKLYT